MSVTLEPVDLNLEVTTAHFVQNIGWICST